MIFRRSLNAREKAMQSGRIYFLTLLILFSLAGLTACASETPAPIMSRPAPTWTPTATSLPGFTSPTAPTLTPTPARTRPPATATATSAATPAAIQRIDAAGPEPVATIAPLPPGQGRSPVRIIIPSLGLDAPVKPMGWRVIGDHTEWSLPDFAAGHHIDSAFPGESGNVVISGHHNIGGSVFASISRIGEPGVPLGLGDEIILEDELGRRFVYRITGWRRIPEADASSPSRQENASYLLPTDFPQLTLITCWPANSNTHRVIVISALTEIRTP